MYQLWVKRQDMIRPCPNPDITVTHCGLDMPIKTPPDYRAWFNNHRATAYCTSSCAGKCCSVGGLWTQLGYTYDWGNPDSDIGLSEFLVAMNVTVYIESVDNITAYCTKP
jgi:hypothetical protein